MQSIFRKLGALLLLIPAVAGATTVLDFSAGFAGSGTSLNYNSGAQISGTRARLTDGGTSEARSVWSKNQVDIRKFSCQFSFQISHGSGDEAGFTFTIQRSGNTVSGYPYEALGYAPISPSVAVKFDIWPSVSTTGIYLNGADPSDNPPSSIDMAPSGINLHNGHIFNVSFTYDGATLHQTVTDATDVTHPLLRMITQLILSQQSVELTPMLVSPDNRRNRGNTRDHHLDLRRHAIFVRRKLHSFSGGTPSIST